MRLAKIFFINSCVVFGNFLLRHFYQLIRSFCVKVKDLMDTSGLKNAVNRIDSILFRICISGETSVKRFTQKIFIASKYASSKIKAGSIGGPGPYLAPGAFLNGIGKKLPKNDATAKCVLFYHTLPYLIIKILLGILFIFKNLNTLKRIKFFSRSQTSTFEVTFEAASTDPI